MKMYLKMSSAKCQPFYLRLNVLIEILYSQALANGRRHYIYIFMQHMSLLYLYKDDDASEQNHNVVLQDYV